MDIVEFQKNRISQLDIMRGLTCLWIVLFHYTSRFYVYYDQPKCWRVDVLFADDVVKLFFAISGFVIFMKLEKTKRPLDFIVSRFSRLFPIFWLTLFMASMLILRFQIPYFGPVTLNSFLINATMLPSFFNTQFIDGIYWTLSVELVFYAIMFFIFVFRSLHSTHIIASVLLVVSCAIVQMSRMGIIEAEFANSFLRIAWFFPWFSVGIAAYQFYRDKRIMFKGFLLLTMAFVAILFTADTRYQQFVDGGVAALFLAVLFYKPHPFMKPLVFLGAISYTLYLIHQSVGFVLVTNFYKITNSVNVSIFLGIAGVLIIASFLNIFVERPFVRFIRDIYKNLRKPDRIDRNFS